MKIKNLVVWVLSVGIAFFGSVFAFEPNEQQQEEISSLKTQIAPLIESDNQTLWSLYQQARDLHPHFKKEKTAYYLEHLRDYLLTKLLTRKELAKAESKDQKSAFLAQYQGS